MYLLGQGNFSFIGTTGDEPHPIAHPIMMLFSALRIFGHTACGILSARSNNFYHASFFALLIIWFAPLFCMEAVTHLLLFIYEFLFNYYRDWLINRQTFCIYLVTEMHFLTNIMIFLYVWAIFYFLFQEDERKTHAFAFFLFSVLFLVTLISTVYDAFHKEESICVSRNRTGFSFVFMVASAIVECLTILVLVGWWACGPHTGHNDHHTWFVILLTAVAVKLPGLDLFQHTIIHHAYGYVLIPLRAIPLTYPIVFIYVTKGRLYTSFRIINPSEID